MTARTVWFLVPDGLDDRERVSGGNVYDRRLRDGLLRRGWDVRMLAAEGPAAVRAALAAAPRGAVVLADGLVAGWDPDALESARGIRLVILAHMVAAAFPDAGPAARDAERRALAGADRVIATSVWAAGELVRRGLVAERRVTVARPGALGAARSDPARSDPAQPNPAPDEGELLCVGVIAPHKGQDVLLEALARLESGAWACTLAGSTATSPEFAAHVARLAARFDGRVRMPGVLDAAQLDRAYRRAGVVVAPSLAESYGMAIADARRRGLPVITSDAGGIREAVGDGGALLVPAGDAEALAHALRCWLDDPALRGRLHAGAALARAGAPRWADTITRVERVLAAA